MDGTGKSSLVTQLMQDIPDAVLRVRARADREVLQFMSDEEKRQEVFQAISDDWESARYNGPTYIYDRLFFSELVYSRAYGRRTAFSIWDEHKVMSMMQALGTVVIRCVATPILAGQPVAVRTQASAITFEYNRVCRMAHNFGVSIQEYDYRQGRYEKLVRHINQCIGRSRLGE